jgi:hypothetical protein
MMELLVEAERYLSHGLLDQAERLFRRVADADPKSSIAVVGLARVALDRGDDATAYAFGRRALAIDPDNPAARHLVMRLEEVVRGRGEELPSEIEIARITGSSEAGIAPPALSPAPMPPPAPMPAATETDATDPGPAPAAPVPRARQAGSSARRPGLLGRLFDRRRHK